MIKGSTNGLITVFAQVDRLIRERVWQGTGFNFSTMLRLEALRYVSEQPNIPMKELARHFGITPPSATSLVNGLVKAGELRRSSDYRDRRLIRLNVTPKGRTALNKGFKEKAAHFQKFLSPLDERDRAVLIKILEKIGRAHI